MQTLEEENKRLKAYAEEQTARIAAMTSGAGFFTPGKGTKDAVTASASVERAREAERKELERERDNLIIKERARLVFEKELELKAKEDEHAKALEACMSRQNDIRREHYAKEDTF